MTDQEQNAIQPARAYVVGPPKRDEWASIAHQANIIAETEFVPSALRKRPAAVAAAMLTARELGIGPMQGLQSIHVIEGKPTLSAELQRALIRRAGHQISVKEKTRERAVLWGKRGDTGEEQTVEWTIDDAVAAGLCTLEGGKVKARSRDGRPLPWERFTRQMLLARATSELASDLFPDVLCGVSYTADELSDGEEVAPSDLQPEDAPDNGGEDIVDGELVPDEPDRKAEATGDMTSEQIRQAQRAASKGASDGQEGPGEAASEGGAQAPERAEADEQTSEAAQALLNEQLGAEPATESSSVAEPMCSTAQVTKISILQKELGIDNAELRELSEAVAHGRQINSRKELTKKEASALIEVLQENVEAERKKKQREAQMALDQAVQDSAAAATGGQA